MLIKMNDNGLCVDNNEVVLVSSRYVAQVFGKRHSHVLNDAKSLKSRLKTLVNKGSLEKNSQPKIRLSSYISEQNKKVPEYLLDEKAFTLLVMGYNTEKALEFKLWYIDQFNAMKHQLQLLNDCKMNCPQLTDELKRINTTGNVYIYATEFNMINKIVLGVSTNDFRKQHNIKKGDSIRPYLSAEQIKQVDKLQQFDSNLVMMGLDYEERKQKLEWYYKNRLKVPTSPSNQF